MKLGVCRRQIVAWLTVSSLGPASLADAAESGATSPVVTPVGGNSAAVEGFVDLMSDFWTVYDAHINVDLSMRAQQLFENFFRVHEDAYRLTGYPATLDDVKRMLPGMDRRAAAARAVSAEFARDYARNLARFQTELPDFDGRSSPVTLLPSLGHFDAHLQPNGVNLPLFFDPDLIVYFHGADVDLNVLFSHELFHCYQGQKNPSMCLDPKAPLYVSLWNEGTAVYASERMNPGASPLHVLLDDRALLQADALSLRAAARAMLQHLDATDDATQSLFFDTGNHGDAWPPRAGYAVGLRIARRLGATLSLAQLAALPALQVRETLAQALRNMASNEAPQA